MLPDALKNAGPPTKKVAICLRPDLVEEYEKLERSRRRDTLGDKTVARRAELEDEIRAATVTFTLKGLPRRRWTQLLAEHPAEKGNKEQEALGYNADSFHEALLHESVVDPALDEEAWERLDEILTEGHWQRLWLAAQSLNINSLDLPFA